MIYGLWLLKKTGECLIHRVYRDSKLTRKDSSLLGSLFVAIDQTAKVQTGKELCNIDTKDTKLSYTNFDKFSVVVATDNDLEGERIGKEIGEQFNKAYGDKLPTWDGRTAIFEKFKQKVDQIVKFHETGLEEELNELLDTLSLCSENEKTSKE
jgi:5S rRNA maturation endonuclease (ribonuclease M5)